MLTRLLICGWLAACGGAVLALMLLAACAPHAAVSHPPAPLGLDEYFPVPEDNPLTPERIELGRRLFFDARLSADRAVACASCHRPGRAFSDTVARSRGVYGRVGTRNAPALVNLAYARSLFWDGRAATLEEQVLRPIQDTLEMDLRLDELLTRLRRDPYYAGAFRRIFGEAVSASNVARALATFVRSLRIGGASLDRFLAGDTAALSPLARQGRALFLGKANCSACHVGPNLTDEQFHNTGVSWGSGDLGRFAVTGKDEDRGRFSPPTLREVACTAPYMHDGSMRSLEEIVEFYDRGGHPNPNLDPEIRPLGLKPEEQRALVAFLRSFTTLSCQFRASESRPTIAPPASGPLMAKPAAPRTSPPSIWLHDPPTVPRRLPRGTSREAVCSAP